MINFKQFWDLLKGNVCKMELDKIEKQNEEYALLDMKNEELNQQINILQNKINSYEKQIDYSFIPAEFKEIEGDVTTQKYEEMGVIIPLDIRDLLNSTSISRKVADEVIKQLNTNKPSDELFVDICLKVNNYLAPKIKYKTNQQQFSKLDVWCDGDIGMVTGYCDCDLSARFYIRVINDCLEKLKLYEYKKYLFLGVGMIPQGGHAFLVIYNPIKKRFDLSEATEDFIKEELQELPSYYDVWFMHNYKKVFWKNEQWRAFL